jgi:exosortase family protein XrtF
METKKAFQFTITFAICYIILNGLYQYILWLFAPNPDPFTLFTSIVFCKLFTKFKMSIMIFRPAILISYEGKKLVNIAEGCNGIAVISTFLSFVVAFRSNLRNYLKFVPLAITIILFFNILRLYLLIEIKIYYNNLFDVFHTYVFPAIIYFITFILMVLWVKFIDKKTKLNLQ